MARERKYADAAAKQAAYRERTASRRAAATAGYTDKELGQAVRELHREMQDEIKAGHACGEIELLIGETPAATLRNICRRLMPPPSIRPL